MEEIVQMLGICSSMTPPELLATKHMKKKSFFCSHLAEGPLKKESLYLVTVSCHCILSLYLAIATILGEGKSGELTAL